MYRMVDDVPVYNFGTAFTWGDGSLISLGVVFFDQM